MNECERRRTWFRFVVVAGVLCTVGMAVAVATGSLAGVILVLGFSTVVGLTLFATVVFGKGRAGGRRVPLR